MFKGLDEKMETSTRELVLIKKELIVNFRI